MRLPHLQVEVLNGLMEELHTHTRTLKANEDTTFTEPVRRSARSYPLCPDAVPHSCIMNVNTYRFNNVYKHVEFHAKQRELKLQASPLLAC